MKNILKSLSILFFIFFLVCCNNNKTNIDSIFCDMSLLPNDLTVDNFDVSLIKLNINYKDGSIKEDTLSQSMIKEEDLIKLNTAGLHDIHFIYENFSSYFTIEINPIKYLIKFLDIDDNVISEQMIVKGESAMCPEYPEFDGFEFQGLSSNKYENVNENAEIKPIYNLINADKSLNDAYQILYEKYNNYKVNDDLDLETRVNHIKIEWKSLNNYLESNGKFDRPYVASNLDMQVTLSYGEHNITRILNMKCDGYKNIDSNIASGYVYRNYYSLNEEFFDTIDIVYCAFLLFNGDGSLQDNGYVLASVKNNISEKANKAGTYVILSLGGGGSDPSRAFREVCSDPVARANFINNVIDIINEYGFDGVDIDWETPSYSQRQLFTTLAKELNEAVKANNPHHLVTAAIGGGKWQPSCYDLPNSIEYLDFVNVMTYSMCSSGGYYQNALYSSPSYHNTTYKAGRTMDSCSIEESIEIYNDLGVENSKLIFGLAFYGIVQSNTKGYWVKSQNVDYSTIVSKYLNNPEYTYYYDENAQVPYLLKNDGTMFISYDDHTSILAKSNYMKEMGCAGLMYWENGCDLTGELLKAMKEGLK